MRFLSLLSLAALCTFASAADHTTMNTMCPVSGKPIDATVKTTPYNSKTDNTGKASPGGTHTMVGFCSAHCHDTYKKDPAKYQEGLEKQKTSAK